MLGGKIVAVVLALLAAFPAASHHAGRVAVVRGGIASPFCLIAKSPSGDATPILSSNDNVDNAPTNMDDLDVTAFGMTTNLSAGTVTAEIQVVNLGNTPAGLPEFSGFGGEWTVKVVGPKATYVMEALFPGRMNPGGADFFVSTGREVVAYESGTLDYVDNQVRITAKLGDLKLSKGDHVMTPVADTSQLDSPYYGTSNAVSPSVVPSIAPENPFNRVYTYIDYGMQNANTDYVVGKSC